VKPLWAEYRGTWWLVMATTGEQVTLREVRIAASSTAQEITVPLAEVILA
jgi:hypothetical protein